MEGLICLCAFKSFKLIDFDFLSFSKGLCNKRENKILPELQNISKEEIISNLETN